MSYWAQSRTVRNRGMLAFLIAASLLPMTIFAQDPLKTLPNNYRSVFDNADLTVIRAHYGPHEKIPVHDPSRRFNSVCLSQRLQSGSY